MLQAWLIGLAALARQCVPALYTEWMYVASRRARVLLPSVQLTDTTSSTVCNSGIRTRARRDVGPTDDLSSFCSANHFPNLLFIFQMMAKS